MTKSTSERQSNSKSTSDRQSNLLFVCCSLFTSTNYRVILAWCDLANPAALQRVAVETLPVGAEAVPRTECSHDGSSGS